MCCRVVSRTSRLGDVKRSLVQIRCPHLRFASAQKPCGSGGDDTGAVDRVAAVVVGSLTNGGSIVTFCLRAPAWSLGLGRSGSRYCGIEPQLQPMHASKRQCAIVTLIVPRHRGDSYGSERELLLSWGMQCGRRALIGSSRNGVLGYSKLAPKGQFDSMRAAATGQEYSTVLASNGT
jgi:hypothetical protein